jgi:hypothetical protein
VLTQEQSCYHIIRLLSYYYITFHAIIIAILFTEQFFQFLESAMGQILNRMMTNDFVATIILELLRGSENQVSTEHTSVAYRIFCEGGGISRMYVCVCVCGDK